eukprot:1855577-Rhodomonas_salina.2
MGATSVQRARGHEAHVRGARSIPFSRAATRGWYCAHGTDLFPPQFGMPVTPQSLTGRLVPSPICTRPACYARDLGPYALNCRHIRLTDPRPLRPARY